MKRKKRKTLEEAERKAQEIGRIIGGQMPHGWGFVLILASYGESGSSTYVSSCHRGTIPSLLREMAIQLETGEGRLGIRSDELDPDFRLALQLLVTIGHIITSPFVGVSVNVSDIDDGSSKLYENEVRRVLRDALKQSNELIHKWLPDVFDDHDEIDGQQPELQ